MEDQAGFVNDGKLKAWRYDTL